jgi:hypothetical protein
MPESLKSDVSFQPLTRFWTPFQGACSEWIPLCTYYTETCRWVLEVELRLELVFAGNYINHVLLAFRPADLNLGSVDRLQGVRELGLGGGGGQ